MGLQESFQSSPVLKSTPMCLKKGQFIQEMPARLGERGWFLLCVVVGFFFLSTVWLHVMSPITVLVPSLSRSKVMRFPNYCHLNERLGRRGFLLLV